MVVQVNGKVRGHVTLAAGADEDAAVAAARATRVVRPLDGARSARRSTCPTAW